MTVSTLTLRQTKGARLTTVEMDNNWLYCSDASNASFIQSGTAPVSETIQDYLRRGVVMVTSYMSDAQRADYAAKTATIDMTVAIQNAAARVQTLGGGVLWFPPGKARVFSTTTGNLCSFTSLDGIACLGYGATIEVYTSKSITASEGIFFAFDGCKNILVDGFLTNGPVLDVSSTTVKGYEYVRCTNGCRNVVVRGRVKNSLSGFIASKLSTDADTMRTQNIELDLDIENCWYGASGVYSGDNVRAKIRTNGVHRSFFFYGASHIKADIWSKDHKAVDVLLRTNSGVTLEDVKINYASGVDSTSCGDIEKISLQFDGQTPGLIRDVEINVNDRRHTSGNTAGALVMIRKYTDASAEDASDRGHKLENLKISGSLTGTPSYNSGGGFLMSTGATWGTGDFFSNIALENLRIDSSDSKCAPLFTLANLTDQMILKNVYSAGYITIRNDTSDVQIPKTGKLLLDNVTCLNRSAVSTAQPLDNVRPFSSPYTLPVGWSGKTINNSNAGGNSVYTLPAATVGLEYTFVRTDATIMDVDVNGAETFRGAAAGQILRLNAAGNIAKIACYTAGTWEIVYSVGATSFV